MKRSLIAAAAALVAVLGSTTLPATAGTAADPEIADGVGDANFVNGQGTGIPTVPGLDTRPASLANMDLRAVWFETTYATNRVVDPGTGAILRVEYVPTGLLVHVRTEAPVWPMQYSAGNLNARFRVMAQNFSASCQVALWLNVPHANMYLARVNLEKISTACPGGLGNIEGAMPLYQGAVSTLRYPFSAGETFAGVLSAGQIFAFPWATSALVTQDGATRVVVDEARAGRNFTIGQDVPPNVDCTATPGHPECQP